MYSQANKKLWRLCGAMALALAVGACSSGSDNGEGTIEPSNANAVAQAVGLKLGAQEAAVQDGDPPASKGDPGEPLILNLPKSETVSAGDSKMIVFDTNQDSPLQRLYAKVTGSGSYFEVNLASPQSLATKQAGGDIELEVAIPFNLGPGTFCVAISVEDEDARVSPAQTLCFTNPADVVERLQGVWERCIDGNTLERLTFGPDEVERASEQRGANCTGDVQGEPDAGVFEYSVGAPVTTDSGAEANELNVRLVEPGSGDPEFDIVAVDDSSLFLGQGVSSNPDDRPTALQDQPFTRPSDDNGDTPPNGGSDAEVLQRAQGAWQRCDPFLEGSSFRRSISFDGNTAVSSVVIFDGEDCNGNVVDEGSSVASLTVGGKVQTTGGQTADELDVVIQSVSGNIDDEPGDQFFDIIWINESGTQLVLGDDAGERPADRPDTLNFESQSFARVN